MTKGERARILAVLLPRACCRSFQPVRPVALQPPALTAASMRRPVQPPALGRGGGGRERQAALRPEPGPALHAGKQHQAGRERGGVGPAASGLDGQDQPLRRAGGRRAFSRATWFSTAGATRPWRRCYATDSTLAGACDTDPFTRLRQLADALRAKGVRAITGDIVGDGSYFEPTLVHPNWEAFDLNWWYAAPVSGLGFNDNSVDFDWVPGAAPGAPAVITMNPDLGDISLENRTVTVPAGGRVGHRRPILPPTGYSPNLGRRHRGARQPVGAPIHSRCPIRTSLRPVPCGRCWRRPASPSLGTTRSTTDSTALRHRARHRPSGRGRLAAAPRLDLSHPQHQPELVCRDAAEAAGQAIRQRRLLARRARGRAAVSDRLGEDRFHPVLAERWLRSVQQQPGEPAGLHSVASLHPPPSRATPPSPRVCRSPAWSARSGTASLAPLSPDGSEPRPEVSPGYTPYRAISSWRRGRRSPSRWRPIITPNRPGPCWPPSTASWWRWPGGELGAGLAAARVELGCCWPPPESPPSSAQKNSRSAPISTCSGRRDMTSRTDCRCTSRCPGLVPSSSRRSPPRCSRSSVFFP